MLLGPTHGLPDPDSTVAKVGTLGPTNSPVKDTAVAPGVSANPKSLDEIAAVNVVAVTDSTTIVKPFKNVNCPVNPCSKSCSLTTGVVPVYANVPVPYTIVNEEMFRVVE